jgi:hypothetical protein
LVSGGKTGLEHLERQKIEVPFSNFPVSGAAASSELIEYVKVTSRKQVN